MPEPLTTIPTIHWRETKSLESNQFLFKINPLMFLDDGYTVLRTFKPAGRAWGREKPVSTYFVRYDREYVTEWLLKNVLTSLPGITHVMMRELMTDALKLRKQREEAKKNDSD